MTSSAPPPRPRSATPTPLSSGALADGGYEVDVCAFGEARMVPEGPAPSQHVHAVQLLDQNDEVRNAAVRETHPGLARREGDARLGPQSPDGLQVYLGDAVAQPCRDDAGVSGEAETCGGSDPQFDGESGAAERRVSAQFRETPISVEVADPKCFPVIG